MSSDGSSEILRIGLDASGSVTGAKMHSDATKQVARDTEAMGKQVDATEKQLTTNLRANNAARIADKKLALEKEVELARKAKREMEKLGLGGRAEFDEIRKQHLTRVEIARAAYREEVSAVSEAQRAMMASTTAMSGATKAAAVNMNTLRGSLTSFANYAVGTAAPGTAAFVSALGGMALGAGTMVAVLAGLVAVSLALRKLTQDAREAKESAKTLLTEIDRAAKAQEDPLGKAQLMLGGAREQHRLAVEAMIRARTPSTVESASGKVIQTLDPDEAAVARAMKNVNTWRDAITKAENEVTRIQKLQSDARAKDAKTAATEAQQVAEKAERERREYIDTLTSERELVTETMRVQGDYTQGMSKLIDLYKEIDKRVAAGNLTLAERNKLLREQAAITDAMVKSGVVGNGLKFKEGWVGMRGLPGQASPAAGDIAGGSLTPPGARSFWDGVRAEVDDIKKLFDGGRILDNIAGNLATSGINAFMSGFTEMVTEIFNGGEQAKRAAEQYKQMREAVTLSLAGARSNVYGGAATEQYDLLRNSAEYGEIRRGINDTFESRFGNPSGRTRSSAEYQAALAQRNRELEEANKLEAESARIIRENNAFKKQSLADDVEILRLQAAGSDAAAVAMAREVEKKRELFGVTDESIRALIEEKHALQDVIEARQKEIEKARQLADFMGNLLSLEVSNAQAGTQGTRFDADAWKQYQDAVAAQSEFSAARALDDAKKMLDAGVITQELFDRLASALGIQLQNAINGAADAAARAAEAFADAKRSFEDSLTLAGLEQMGDSEGAAALRANIQAREWRKQAEELFTGDELKAYLDRINSWLEGELARLSGGGVGGVTDAALSASGGPRRDVTIQSVTGITETSALRLVDISRSQLGVQQNMSATLMRIERKIRPGAGGGIDFGDINRRLGQDADHENRLNGNVEV